MRPAFSRLLFLALTICLARCSSFAQPDKNTQAMLGQSFQVIHYFSGTDGTNPAAGITVGNDGVLYGNTLYGIKGYGGVYELKQTNSTWSFIPLYLFNGGADGGNPVSGIVIASDKTLYGTTAAGGNGGMGVVYRLTPSPAICATAFCYLSESVVYAFSGRDGSQPGPGPIVFDQAGNIYGTTPFGGDYGQGVVYMLTKSGNTWTEAQRHSFAGFPNDGSTPQGGVVFDSSGNFYGTTEFGGTDSSCYYRCGAVYKITPSGQTWTESIIHNFGLGSSGGYWPWATLVMDHQGNLYGSNGCSDGFCPAAIFQLVPTQDSWTYNPLSDECPNNYSSMAIDAAGNLYGACASPSFVFKLSYSNNQWQLQHLHDFQPSEGSYPVGSVALDSNGNLFGTAEFGGNHALGCDPEGCGTVWEIAGVAAPARQVSGSGR